MAPNKKQQSGKKEVDPLSVVWDRLSLSTISKADFEQLTEVEQRLEFDLGVSIEHIALADLKLLKSHFGNRKLSQEIWDHLFGHCEMQSVERVRQFLVLIAQLIAEPGEMQVAASAAYMELLRVENCPMWASVYRGPLLHKIVKLTCTCLKPPKDAPAGDGRKKQAKKKGTASKAAAAAASGNDDHEDGLELNLSDNLDGANPGINGNETAEDREERERSESLAPLNRALLRQLVLLCDEQPLGRTIDAVGFLIEDFTKLVLEPRDEEIVDLAFAGLKGVVKWNEKYFLSDDAVQEELDARAKLQEEELRGGDLGEGGQGGGNKGILEDVLKEKEAKAAEDAKAGELEQEQRKKMRVLLQLVSVIYTGVLPVIGMFRPGRGLPQNLPKIWKYGRDAGIKFVAELLGKYPLLAEDFPFEIANEDSDDEMEDETAGGVGTEEKSSAKSPGKKGGARSPGKQKLKLEEDIEMEDAFAAESPAATKKTKKEPKSTAKKLKRGQKDKGGKKKKDAVVSDDDDDEEDENKDPLDETDADVGELLGHASGKRDDRSLDAKLKAAGLQGANSGKSLQFPQGAEAAGDEPGDRFRNKRPKVQEYLLDPVNALLQQLLLDAPDRADVREPLCEAVVTLVPKLPFDAQARFLVFTTELMRSELNSRRGLSTEVCARLMDGGQGGLFSSGMGASSGSSSGVVAAAGSSAADAGRRNFSKADSVKQELFPGSQAAPRELDEGPAPMEVDAPGIEASSGDGAKPVKAEPQSPEEGDPNTGDEEKAAGAEPAAEGTQCDPSPRFIQRFLLQAIVERTKDQIPTVRSKALSAVATCLKLLDDESQNEALGNPNGPYFVNTAKTFAQYIGAERTTKEKVAALAFFDALMGLLPKYPVSMQFCPDAMASLLSENSVLVRKNAVSSLTSYLKAAPDNKRVVECWVRGVIGSVVDVESAMVEKTLEVIDEIIFTPLVRWARNPDFTSRSRKDHAENYSYSVRRLSKAAEDGVRDFAREEIHVPVDPQFRATEQEGDAEPSAKRRRKCGGEADDPTGCTGEQAQAGFLRVPHGRVFDILAQLDSESAEYLQRALTLLRKKKEKFGNLYNRISEALAAILKLVDEELEDFDAWPMAVWGLLDELGSEVDVDAELLIRLFDKVKDDAAGSIWAAKTLALLQHRDVKKVPKKDVDRLGESFAQRLCEFSAEPMLIQQMLSSLAWLSSSDKKNESQTHHLKRLMMLILAKMELLVRGHTQLCGGGSYNLGGGASYNLGGVSFSGPPGPFGVSASMVSQLSAANLQGELDQGSYPGEPLAADSPEHPSAHMQRGAGANGLPPQTPGRGGTGSNSSSLGNMMHQDELFQKMLEEPPEGKANIQNHLFTLGELALLHTDKKKLLLSEENLVTYLRTIASNQVTDREAEAAAAGASRGVGAKKLVKMNLPAVVRAQAFVALIKMCLKGREQGIKLAKDQIEFIVLHLEDPSVVVRNNLLIGLGDLARAYTNLVDRYVGNMSDCLRDAHPLLRKQAAMILASLVAEDFVKLKGALHWRLIYALSDPNYEVRHFVQAVFCKILHPRDPKLYQENFCQTISALNGYVGYKYFEESGRNMEKFSLLKNQKRRTMIYDFFINQMSQMERITALSQIMDHNLGHWQAEGVPFPTQADSPGGALLVDSLTVLSCKEMRSACFSKQKGMDLGGPGEAERNEDVDQKRQEAASNLTSAFTKKIIKENVMPTLGGLKQVMERTHSPFKRILDKTLLAVVYDYRDDLASICDDPQMAQELAYDLKLDKEVAQEKLQQELADQGLEIDAGAGGAAGGFAGMASKMFGEVEMKPNGGGGGNKKNPLSNVRVSLNTMMEQWAGSVARGSALGQRPPPIHGTPVLGSGGGLGLPPGAGEHGAGDLRVGGTNKKGSVAGATPFFMFFEQGALRTASGSPQGTVPDSRNLVPRNRLSDDDAKTFGRGASYRPPQTSERNEEQPANGVEVVTPAPAAKGVVKEEPRSSVSSAGREDLAMLEEPGAAATGIEDDVEEAEAENGGRSGKNVAKGEKFSQPGGDALERDGMAMEN